MEHGSVTNSSASTFSIVEEDHTHANSIRFVLNQDLKMERVDPPNLANLTSNLQRNRFGSTLYQSGLHREVLLCITITPCKVVADSVLGRSAGHLAAVLS
ncbi:hypothetical protein PR202_ga24458 [Eleusine coracana subsp. coracana]|uniref:Uncharacterized protein n=1 Tax=Eleusine coracana subsp. coracana TaxID=191504 RepID=A0AAV5D9A4_ELECO|nr:hypothetical protein PR202_ga24458 [Eleusine coracana subsp. coracana]